MKFLVTGGTGFLGQNLVAALRARGDHVRVLAHTEPTRRPADAGVEVVWGDIRDRRVVGQAARDMDYVIHTVSNFRKAGSDKHEARAVNVEGSLNVCRASKAAGVRQLVHCSTIGVHGSVKEVPATEETPFNPGDLYQETKLEAEQEVWKFYESEGLPVTVIRPISIIGPGDLRMLKLFRMIKNRRFVMVGGGEALFQPAYIDDVVQGFLLSVGNEKAIGEAFIVGGEEYVPLKTLVQMIADEFDVGGPWIRVPMAPMLALARLCELGCAPLGIEPPLHRRRISFFQNNRAFKVDKAKRLLGFAPQVGLREGLRKTIDAYTACGWL
jgi:dihydroflavonol-4-reductase